MDWTLAFSGWEIIANGVVTTFATALGVFGAFWLDRYDKRRSEIRRVVSAASELVGALGIKRWERATKAEHGSAVEIHVPQHPAIARLDEIMAEMWKTTGEAQAVWFAVRLEELNKVDAVVPVPAHGDPYVAETRAGLDRMLGFWPLRHSAGWYHRDRMRLTYTPEGLDARRAQIRNEQGRIKMARSAVRDWFKR